MPVASGGLWAAVLGDPIGHSLSPALHTAAYEALGLDLDYRRIRTGESEAQSVIAPAVKDPRWCGFSVTMPLKACAVDFADRLGPVARQVGVINTLVPIRGQDGSTAVLGENTDVAGILGALHGADSALPEDHQMRSGGGPARAVIIGAGGTAAAAAVALHRWGACSVEVFLRRPGRAGLLREAAERIGLRVGLHPIEEAPEALQAADLVVCTLPAHAFDELAERLSGSGSRPDLQGLRLLDVAYDPWPSRLAVGAARCGAQVVSGLEMLYHQAVAQVRLFSAAARGGEDLDPVTESGVRTAMRASVGLMPT